MKKEVKIVMIGSGCIDEYYEMDYVPKLGEKTLCRFLGAKVGGMIGNAAAVAASYGMETYLMDSINRSASSEKVLEDFRNSGVRLDLVRRDESLPDVKCLIFLNGGERIIYVIPTEKRDLVPNVMEMETLQSADYVYTTVGELNCFRDPASLMESLKAHGVTVVLDVEYISDENRQAEWELIQRAGILFINAEGDRHLLEKISENYKEVLCRRGCMAVVTDGEHGCTTYGTDGAIVKSGAYQVKPVDTTGAGDTFNTSFLYGLSYGMSLEEAGNFANGAAARSILYMGPRSGAVGEDAVWEFINHWKAFW